MTLSEGQTFVCPKGKDRRKAKAGHSGQLEEE
jgi:hypothetical protein